MGPDWVLLKKYCELVGTTPKAVHCKRQTGLWRDGDQCIIGPDGNLYVNLKRSDKWVEKGIQASLEHHRASKSGKQKMALAA